jgi:acetylornithine/succinyldiaminopimelate/putrescine aminotransferase
MSDPGLIRGMRRTGLLYALDMRDKFAGMGFLLGLFQRGVIAVASSQNLAVPKLYPPLILEEEQIAEFAEKAADALDGLA